MSRVGSAPIRVPKGLVVDVKGNIISLSKEKELFSYDLPNGLHCLLKDDCLYLSSVDIDVSLLGLYRSDINNFILGISKGFSVTLDIFGVGYKASISNGYLVLFLGLSHSVRYRIPSYVNVQVDKTNVIFISGIDKHNVNMFSADICSIKKYNPYKKKGIVVRGKYIFSKEMNKK